METKTSSAVMGDDGTVGTASLLRCKSLFVGDSERSLSWKAGRKDMDMCLLRHFRKCHRFLQTFGWKIIYVCLRTGLRYWNGELMRPDYTHHLKFSFTTSLNKKNEVGNLSQSNEINQQTCTLLFGYSVRFTPETFIFNMNLSSNWEHIRI